MPLKSANFKITVFESCETKINCVLKYEGGAIKRGHGYGEEIALFEIIESI